jgi:two-component system response regulator VicR
MESSVHELHSIFVEGARARLAGLEQTLERLREAGEGAAVRDLRDIFHTLAGAGGTYGYPAVSAISRRAEADCEAVMGGKPAAPYLAGWAAAITELHAAIAERPSPPPVAGEPSVLRSSSRIILCADPRAYRMPVPADSIPGHAVEVVESPALLAAALGGGPLGGVVIAPGESFPDTAALVRAVRAHPQAERVPIVVLLDQLSLVGRIELVQLGANRILPRETPWEVLITLLALAQPAQTERGTVFILEHDEALSRRLSADLEHGRSRAQTSVFRELPALLSAWQEQAADLLVVGRDASGAPHLPVVASLRKRERLRALPVLMLLDRGDEASRRAVFEQGLDDYVLLPYVREELVARVDVRLRLRWASRRLGLLTARARPRPAAAVPPPVAAASKVRVLVADDDPLVAKALESSLRAEGWELMLALNGEQAERLIEQSTFDLVLLDLNMPFRSGFDLLQWMSQRGLKGRSRVAVLSALNRDEAVLRAFALEADDFISKPFNPEVVTSRLRRLLRR